MILWLEKQNVRLHAAKCFVQPCAPADIGSNYLTTSFLLIICSFDCMFSDHVSYAWAVGTPLLRGDAFRFGRRTSADC